MSSNRIALVGSIVNPLHLTPALWLDFGDPATLFDATSGGSTPANGGGIARVEDKSGNAHHYTQATAGNRPTYQTAVQNGLSIGRFNGTAHWLASGARTIIANSNAATIVAVRKWSASPTAARSIWSCSTNNGTNSRAQLYGGNAANVQGVGGRIGNNASTFAGLDGGTNVSTSVFEIDTGLLDAGANALTLWLNGTQTGTGAFLNGSFPNNSSQNSRIGSLTTNTQFFQGDISEVLVFNYGLTAAQRQDVWNYLRYKWGF
jgi:hypothetical protein